MKVRKKPGNVKVRSREDRERMARIGGQTVR